MPIAASGSNPTESALVQQLQAEVTRLTNALQLQQQQLQQMQQQFRANPQPMEGASIANLPTATNAVVPCAHAVRGLTPTLATTTKVMASSYAPPASIAKGAAFKGDEDFLPWRDNQTEEDMQAAPTPKTELNAEPVGSTPPSPPIWVARPLGERKQNVQPE